jgi:hypothetical protein
MKVKAHTPKKRAWTPSSKPSASTPQPETDLIVVDDDGQEIIEVEDDFKKEWGLTLCTKPCEVCNRYGENLYQLRHIRDLYCQGVSEFALSRFFEVSRVEINKHVYAKRWDRKRTTDPGAIAEQETTMLLKARARDTWHESTPDSADKSLAQLAKMTGVNKHAIKESVVFSWDQHVLDHDESEED